MKRDLSTWEAIERAIDALPEDAAIDEEIIAVVRWRIYGETHFPIKTSIGALTKLYPHLNRWGLPYGPAPRDGWQGLMQRDLGASMPLSVWNAMPKLDRWTYARGRLRAKGVDA